MDHQTRLEAEQAEVLERISAERVLPLVSELIRFQSIAANEDPVQGYIAAALREAGCETDVFQIDFDSLRNHPAFGMEVERDNAIGVAGTFGDGDGPSLILNGHVDVVPPGDFERWTYSPWEATVVKDRVYGRGSCDMKGGLAAILTAVRAIAEQGIRLKGKVIIESVVGEEDGGVGTLATIERGYRADAALIAEPTGLRVGNASAGALTFRVRVYGLSAHGALRQEGVSAIEKFQLVYEALQSLEMKRNDRLRSPQFDGLSLPFAISVGKIFGGEWPSSVPEELIFEGRYGVAPGEDLEAAKREFAEAIAMSTEADVWLREHPPGVEWWGGQFKPAVTERTHPIVDLVTKCTVDVGRDTGVEGMPYGSDLRLLVGEGQTPTVLFGPGDVRVAHKPDEFVNVSEVVDCSRAIALSILRWCGH